MAREVAREKIKTRVEAGYTIEQQLSSLLESLLPLLAVSRSYPTDGLLATVESAYRTWDEYNFELLRGLFDSEEIARSYAITSISYGAQSLQRQMDELMSQVQNKIRKLESILNRLELYEVLPSTVSVSDTDKAVSSLVLEKGVFIVHGRDEATRESVARFLERLGLEPIILHEKPNRGRTIIEKLEGQGGVGYAIVLLTPDDKGALQDASSDQLQPRARQNVIFELGFFIGALGRNRVVALHKREVELPSDYSGMVYISLDEGEGWRLKLAQELKAAGFNIDLNKALN